MGHAASLASWRDVCKHMLSLETPHLAALHPRWQASAAGLIPLARGWILGLAAGTQAIDVQM